jgi:hypothetical protein
MRTLALCAILAVATSVSAETKRDWQDGTWRDSSRVTDTRGAVAVGPSVVLARRVSQQFVIETPEYLYVVEQRLKGRSKPLPMTVNGPVRYAIDKDTVYVIGEDGKEYKLDLTKKTLKINR